jgi:molybdate transport system regulatory protein
MSALMSDETTARISLRIDLPGGSRLGPGKAALMRAIAAEGSLAAAARHLGLSYPKAKRLVDELNAAFCEPLIVTRHGGHERGGAKLSPAGERILALYCEVIDAAGRAAACPLDEIAALASAGKSD